MSQRYSLDDLLYLMDRLRDPETGCSWDLKQTFKSIVPHTIEEAYEVADTIEREDWSHLEDELGDLLFQVIFYSRLGKESDLFNFDSIVNQLVEKLVRRHPHVFPKGKLKASLKDQPLTDEEINAQWEAIKQEERLGKEKQGVLDDIPQGLPALTRAEKLQKRAGQVGFDWNDPLAVLDKIEEEIAELREAIQLGQPDAIEDEMGDLMFAQVNLCRHLNVKSETALRSTNRKFERRFAYIEQQVTESAKDWSDYSLEELDHFWNQAKAKGL